MLGVEDQSVVSGRDELGSPVTTRLVQRTPRCMRPTVKPPSPAQCQQAGKTRKELPAMKNQNAEPARKLVGLLCLGMLHAAVSGGLGRICHKLFPDGVRSEHASAESL